MEQRIVGRDGTVCIIGDTQSIVTGPPIPVEDPRKWQAVKLSEGDVLKLFGGKRERLETAIAHCGFPAAQITTKMARLSWSVTHERTWRENDVAVWVERVRSLGL